jgi:hypothetical protein
VWFEVSLDDEQHLKRLGLRASARRLVPLILAMMFSGDVE